MGRARRSTWSSSNTMQARRLPAEISVVRVWSWSQSRFGNRPGFNQMATTITSECINCGACEPECPNTAIYAGGVPWELNGTPGAAIAQDIYYIVPSKCTECVGFHDHEACAAVCPVDCCIPATANLEPEGVLLQRARELPPEPTFPADAPSRFRKEGGGAEAPAANGAAVAAAPAPAPAAAPKPVAAAPAAAPTAV